MSPRCVSPALARENQEALIHPGCSSDLSRLDYYIFGQLKKSLMGQLFHSDDDGKNLKLETRITVQFLIRTYSHQWPAVCCSVGGSFQEIWILTDSRASIQHLANWGDIGDQTSLDILSLLHDLSSGHSIHFQWIPSHVGIEGNERADFLDGTAAVECGFKRESHIF
ncbi:hypothetical protein TNCV_1743571 [Trichonephila clavipes]|nr:hypothetical protein TNCV_1743571 [Trichonephila clavipes]